jgi:hypothetical protein
MLRSIGRVILFFAILAPSIALAQSDLERFERTLEQIRRENLMLNPDVPPEQRALIDYGGYFIYSYASIDDERDDNHVLNEYDLYLYTRFVFDPGQELFLRGRGGWQDWNDGDSFDGRGDERIDPTLDRGYYRFDLAGYRASHDGVQIKDNLVVKGGRDLVYWANGLVLSQVIDGATIDITSGPIFASVVAGVTTDDLTTDFDASRNDFDTDTSRGFYGLMLGSQVAQTHRPYVYAMFQQDYNDKEDLIVGPVTTEFQYNSYYLGIGSSGTVTDRLLYGIEAVYEGGRGKSNSFEVSGPFLSPIEQTTEDICAWALDARLDYLMTDPNRTRLSLEGILASGDDDRLSTSNTFGGNQPGTNDTAFNAFGLLNTGLAFAPTVSNLMMLRTGVSTFPLSDVYSVRNLQVGVDVFVYAKTDADAPIDEITGDERYLGWEPDVFLNWPITSDVTLAVRYGVFFPNSGNFPDDSSRQFIYVGVTYGF